MKKISSVFFRSLFHDFHRHGKRIYSLLFLFLFTFSFFQGFQVSAQSSSDTMVFSDVSTLNINAQAIQSLKKDGIVQGYEGGSYKPSLPINRAEFAVLMMRILKSDTRLTHCFSDVRDEWYAHAVCELKARGYVAGYPDGSFKPGDAINFPEASTIIAKVFQLVDQKIDQNPWYKKFVNALEAKNAIPLSVSFFDEQITRDEMAEMIWRVKDLVTDKASRSYDEIRGEGFVTVASCEALARRFIDNGYYFNNYNKTDLGGMIQDEIAQPPQAPLPASQEQSASGSGQDQALPKDYSSTNLQVTGVDEADVIKNDGKYIYLIKGNTVRIVEAYPADTMKELVSLTLGEQEKEVFHPQEMYVDNDQLIIIGSASRVLIQSDQIPVPSEKLIAPIPYHQERMKVYILNIEDRTRPSVQRSVDFEGAYHTSRRIDGTLYLVMNHYLHYPYPYYSYMGASVSGQTDSVSPSVGEFDSRILQPKMFDSARGKEEVIAPCDDIKIFPKDPNFHYLITAAVPLKNLSQPVKRSVVAGSTQHVYASKDNLYVATGDLAFNYRPYGHYDTVVYRFALGNGTLEYKNKGRVPGTILNQFSMDENKGYFRIATTKNEYAFSEDDSAKIDNNLYLLDEEMQIVGKIEGIAPGEKIYSTRFMGDRAYMVTFKRVDPLFVIDLADPENPRILGKLKVPGYSTYLHPYDENHILGFGNEVDENVDADKVSSDDFIYYTAVQGMKIGLFDVTDVNNPKELYKEVIGDHGTYSELLANHKALLFDKEKGLLAFPVTVKEIPGKAMCTEKTYSGCPDTCRKLCVPSVCTYENGIRICTADCDGQNSCVPDEFEEGRTVFDGAYVYDIDLTHGFSLRGKITHYSNEDLQNMQDDFFTDYEKTIQRVLFIGENLYTVSPFGIKANVLGGLVEKNMIKLGGTSDQVYWQPME